MSSGVADAKPRRAAAAILVAGYGAMLAMGAPGQLSYDSVVQLRDGRTGHYDTWHPPVMAWLLGLFDALSPGTLLYLLFTSGLTLAALLGLLWLPRRVGWGAAIAAAMLVLTPQWLLYQSDIWKDVLFADAALAGFAALAVAAAHWPGRWPWLIASTVLLALAAMARQNGVVLLPVAGVTLAIIAARHNSRNTALLYGMVFLLATAALVFAVNATLAARGDGGEGVRGELRVAQIYDLAGALKKQPALALTPLDQAAPVLARVLRERGVARYSVQRLDPVMNDQPIGDAIDDAPEGSIFATWRNLVFHHPALYLGERLPVFWQVLGTPDLLSCHPFYTGVGGPPDVLKSLGIVAHRSERAHLLADYGEELTGTPVFSHLTFVALAAAVLVFLLRRRQAADIAVAGLVAGALLFTFTFVIVSVACDYRYLYFLDLAAMAGAVYAACDFSTRTSRRC
jgi:hypothetical protein